MRRIGSSYSRRASRLCITIVIVIVKSLPRGAGRVHRNSELCGGVVPDDIRVLYGIPQGAPSITIIT